MKILLNIYLFILFSVATAAQDVGDFKEMLINAEKVLYTQPEESIKIANHILKTSKNTNQLIEANLLNLTAYFIKGEFENAIKSGVDAKTLAESTQNGALQLKATIAAIPILEYLGLNEVSKRYFLNTKSVDRIEKNQETSLYLKGGKTLLNAYSEVNLENWKQAIQYFNEANKIFQEIPDIILQTEIHAIMATLYSKVYPQNITQQKLELILANTTNENPNNFLKLVALSQLGDLFFQKQNYTESIASYQEALAITKAFDNKNFEASISEKLASAFLALKDTSNFYEYKKTAQKLDEEVETAENQAVNSIYNYINSNNTIKRDSLNSMFIRNILILSAVLLLIILTWILLRFRYQNRLKQYNNFIAYRENRENPKPTTPVTEVPKGLNIPEETENSLLNKLLQFENSKQFTKQDMSLALLASKFDTNTKYLSEVINTHKGKNFNSYINELRINYIIDKLNNNKTYLQYKISYLAEESGFSSHSSFATVFKAVTGIPPTVFIDLLKSAKKSSNAVYEDVE